MSRLRYLLLTACVAACTSGAPATDQPTIRPTLQSTTQPTTAPTPTPTRAPSPTPAADPLFEVVQNADGTVWVTREPGLRFAMPGDDAVWIGVSPNFRAWDISRLDPATNLTYPVIQDLPGLPNPIHGMAVNGSLWLSSWDLDNVRRFDPVSGEKLDELPVGNHPVEPVLAFGDVWTLNHHGNSVSRIDTESGTVQATITMDPESAPIWMSEGAGHIWVVGSTSHIFEVDPETDTLVRAIDTGVDCLMSVAYFLDRLWAWSCDEGEVISVDPESEAVSVEDQPIRVVKPFVAENGWLWLPRAADGDYIDGLVALHPDTAQPVASFDLPEANKEAGFETGFASIWITGRNGSLRVPESVLPTE